MPHHHSSKVRNLLKFEKHRGNYTMHDYTLQIAAKQRMEELNRASARRQWLRDILNAQKADRAARKGQPAYVSADRSQHE